MPDRQDEPLTFDQLPPRVQASFREMRAKLPAEFELRGPRRTPLGWVIGIYTADGHHGGDLSILAEPGEAPQN